MGWDKKVGRYEAHSKLARELFPFKRSSSLSFERFLRVTWQGLFTHSSYIYIRVILSRSRLLFLLFLFLFFFKRRENLRPVLCVLPKNISGPVGQWNFSTTMNWRCKSGVCFEIILKDATREIFPWILFHRRANRIVERRQSIVSSTIDCQLSNESWWKKNIKFLRAFRELASRTAWISQEWKLIRSSPEYRYINGNRNENSLAEPDGPID